MTAATAATTSAMTAPAATLQREIARETLAKTLEPAAWRALEQQHRDRADALSAAHRARKQRGEPHPIEDFLWTYYSYAPSELRRWHPGAGVTLLDAPERRGWRYYANPSAAAQDAAGRAGADPQTPHAVQVDVAAFFEKRGRAVDYIERLLQATLVRTPNFGCFGLHEWAMVYKLRPDEIRHTRLPLRIGHEATDAVVQSHPIGCSHFDAYRFFTPAAAPLNKLSPTRENQVDTEQSACLHAGMDVYKWATKLGPLVPGSLLLDAFELARDIRVVDMQASPYDVTGFTSHDGVPLEPIAIETADGKREYVRRQRGFADRGNTLRIRVLDAIAAARALLNECSQEQAEA